MSNVATFETRNCRSAAAIAWSRLVSLVPLFCSSLSAFHGLVSEFTATMASNRCLLFVPLLFGALLDSSEFGISDEQVGSELLL